MEKSKLLSLIANIFDTAKKDKWQAQYDKSLDVFYWTKPKLSKDSRLTQFINDFSLYITSAGKIEGIFIEYAKYNFVNHNKEFKPLFNAMKIDSKKDAIYSLPKKKEKEMNYLLEYMADKVAKETLRVVSDGFKVENVLIR